MRNADKWVAGKYVLRNGKLSAARNAKELAVGSRLIASLVAKHYEHGIPAHARGRLVDLGCGKAPLYGFYREFVVHSVTVDWPFGRHGDQYLDHECDLNQTLPFADGHFDTIILSDVLEHVAEPQRLCAEMARILAPGGSVLLNVPFLYHLHEKPHDYYRYTDEGLRHLLRESGLSIVELTPIGGSPEVLATFLAKHLARRSLLGKAMAVMLQDATLWFVRTRIGRRISVRSSGKWPLGYFVVARK